jgi:hypothetical protein
VVELVMAVVALASAGIFLAHAIEAYRACKPGGGLRIENPPTWGRRRAFRSTMSRYAVPEPRWALGYGGDVDVRLPAFWR